MSFITNAFNQLEFFLRKATNQQLEIAIVLIILWCVTMLIILFSVDKIKKNTGIIVISLLILFNIFGVSFIIHLIS